jgi:HK97 family phage major capsid protein
MVLIEKGALMPTNFPTLVPEAVAAEVVASVTESESAVMQLARVVRMPSGVEQVPLVTASPTSGFVSPAYGGLKPSSEVEWTAATLTAAEIGVVVPVPDAFLADTSFPVWDSVREEITKSFVRVFEKAAL